MQCVYLRWHLHQVWQAQNTQYFIPQPELWTTFYLLQLKIHHNFCVDKRNGRVCFILQTAYVTVMLGNFQSMHHPKPPADQPGVGEIFFSSLALFCFMAKIFVKQNFLPWNTMRIVNYFIEAMQSVFQDSLVVLLSDMVQLRTSWLLPSKYVRCIV